VTQKPGCSEHPQMRADGQHTPANESFRSTTPEFSWVEGTRLSTALDMTIDELIEEFDFLGDWEDRCDYLIDLGFELPKLPPEAKVEENRVHGCQSNVWLTAQVNETTDPPKIEFLANSDAMIVNGLIAVLMMIFQGRTPEEILKTDVEGIFRRLELDRHLSSQRRNGLFGMVKRIREISAIAQARSDAARDL
jgi:cysteine desulfuration protein SufE